MMDLQEQFPDCRLYANSSGWTVVCDRLEGSILMEAEWGGRCRAVYCRLFAPRIPIPWPWSKTPLEVDEICRTAQRLADQYATPFSG